MKTLPDGIAAYSRTPDFSEDSVPAALLAAHSTKAGVWGRIVVVEGELLYRIYGPPVEEVLLSPGNEGVVEPEVEHEVEPRAGLRFFVEFLR